MLRRDLLPAAFDRYARVGELEFALFDDADGTPEAIVEAVQRALPSRASFDGARLLQLGSRAIDQTTFFGDALSIDGHDLIRRGTWRTADGRELADPTFRQLAGLKVVSGGGSRPAPGTGGNFALAFSHPVHGPADLLAMQDLFDAIRAVLLPPATPAEIRDWTSPQLDQVSDYFRPGLEWWGVYLFSVYLPQWRQLAIVLGSATD